MPPVKVLSQVGYLEPVEGASQSSVEGIFGKSAHSPLVDSHHASSLRMGDGQYDLVGVVQPFSGVQTFDAVGAHDTPETYKPHATNLLHPMHSEGLWLLLLLLAVLGIFSFGIKIGPVRASVG